MARRRLLVHQIPVCGPVTRRNDPAASLAHVFGQFQKGAIGDSCRDPNAAPARSGFLCDARRERGDRYAGAIDAEAVAFGSESAGGLSRMEHDYCPPPELCCRLLPESPRGGAIDHPFGQGYSIGRG